ncbi:MAG: MATE family efflux transporter [Clostridiales bacterium]|jgi:putative MATE family efflux protein|nr:MATE family efflux transporter [Clostridiales bacterium]
MRIFTRERSFYKTFFPLLIVITLQQLASLAVNMVDNLMLGTYTELALSGATIVNQIQHMLQMLISGIAAGVAVLGAQYWGKGEIDPIRRITAIGLKMALGAGVLFFGATQLFPFGVLRLFTSDENVIAEGIKYLRLMCWTYLIFSVSNTLMYSLQSVETAFIGTLMSVSTIIINACLNYLFIYGNLGMPELGITGAAVATLTSRVIELVIITVYILFIDKKLRMKLRHLVSFDLSFFKDFVKISMPLVISGGLWGVAQAAQMAILGHIDATVIAANSIASIIFAICSVIGIASANAASVTIGKTIGSGRLDLVRPYSRTMQAIFVLIGLFSGALLFIFKDMIADLYRVSEETRKLAVNFMIILSITTVGTCYEYPTASGIIAGGGDTKYPAIVENTFMWLFIIPSAALSAFVFHFPPIVTFCFLKVDQILKCIPNAIRCNRYKWVRELTR